MVICFKQITLHYHGFLKEHLKGMKDKETAGKTEGESNKMANVMWAPGNLVLNRQTQHINIKDVAG